MPTRASSRTLGRKTDSNDNDAEPTGSIGSYEPQARIRSRPVPPTQNETIREADEEEEAFDEEMEIDKLRKEKASLERRATAARLQSDIESLRAVLGNSRPSSPLDERTTPATGPPALSERDTGGSQDERAPRSSSKRRRSTMLEEKSTSRSSVKARAPPEYKGRNTKEHLDFIHACTITFRLFPYDYRADETKILYAMQYLAGEPHDAWSRHEATVGLDNISWDDFSQFLRDLVQDPVNRGIVAAQKYHDASQLPGQSVHAFVTYLETLEAEIEPYGETHRRQHLLTKLRPEIRNAITNYQDIPETRAGLISLAARLEENQRQTRQAPASRRDNSYITDNQGQQPKQTPFFNRDNRGRGRGRFMGRGGPPPQTHRSGGTYPNRLPVHAGRGIAPIDTVTCFSCGQKGHYPSSESCPNNTGSSQSKNGETHR
jgi:hypothetical protein